MKALFSVVIPAYRAADVIPRALASVRRQSAPAHEVIVVEDGPDPSLAAVVHRHCPEARIIRQANLGAGGARNTGLDAASGSWVSFLDADDEWDPDHLRRHAEVADRIPDVGFIASRYMIYHEGESQGTIGGPPTALADRLISLRGAEAFDFVANVSTITVSIRRSVIGAERFRTDLPTAEDREFWFRMVQRTVTWVIGDPLATVYAHPTSLSAGDVNTDMASMLRLIRDTSAEIGPRAAKRWEANTYRRWAGVLLDQGRYREALRQAWRRVLLQPFSAEAWWIAARAARRIVTQ